MITTGEPESARDIARRRVREHSEKPFRWTISPEEYAQVEMATIREKRVNKNLMTQVRRMRRWG